MAKPLQVRVSDAEHGIISIRGDLNYGVFLSPGKAEVFTSPEGVRIEVRNLGKAVEPERPLRGSWLGCPHCGKDTMHTFLVWYTFADDDFQEQTEYSQQFDAVDEADAILMLDREMARTKGLPAGSEDIPKDYTVKRVERLN